MKGVILAGGNGRRLNPITNVTNKHLLPVYNQPMIFYPLQTLLNAGIKDIVIVTGTEHAGGFLRLLGSGRDFGARFTFEIQEEAGGIAQALGLAEHVVGDDSVAVILGDNIYEDDFYGTISAFEMGAHIFLKDVPDAHRFGVAELNEDRVVGIEEKPEHPKTDYAVTGFYIYDNTVFDVIKTLEPSGRGELEITDVNNHYIRNNQMRYSLVGGKWTDAGTFESLFAANSIARDIHLMRSANQRVTQPIIEKSVKQVITANEN